MGDNENSDRLYFLGLQHHADVDSSHKIKRNLSLGRKAMINLDFVLKGRDITLLTKSHLVKSMVFQWSSTDVIVAPERILNTEKLILLNCGFGEDSWHQISLDCKENKAVNPEWNQAWIFIGRTDAEAESPILWPPAAKNWLIWKKLWFWEGLKAGGKGHDRGWDVWIASPTWWKWVWAGSTCWWWTGSLECCSPWGRKELDTTERLNYAYLSLVISFTLRAILYDMRTGIHFSFLFHLHRIFSHPLTFSLHVSLGLKWAFFGQHIYGSCFIPNCTRSM